ncbi:uncharacterized protein C227.17c [Asparagus officinalis]|uniref:uncharacterized protein C227.17c n=1 Tax=Asparagus officinalis TaxID=4686 RepID=UPI00098E2E78|nr:uncharacterized protein C227.17c [Asparagus officinalis]
MDNKEGEASNNNHNKQPPHLSCTKCFDALWFCYSPFHQMQQYYRYGEFDTCFGKWSALADCLSLKTKRSSEVQEILEEREKAKPHIWTYRTVEEASENWWRMYNRFYKPPSRPDS